MTRLERLKEIEYLLYEDNNLGYVTNEQYFNLLAEKNRLMEKMVGNKVAAPVSESEFESQLFDGELLKRRLGRFLNRLNTALAESQQHLPDFEIESIWVDTVVGINGNISFPSGAGIGLEHSRSIQFILKPNITK